MITSVNEKMKQVQTGIKTMLMNEITSLGLLSDVEEIHIGEKINLEKLDYPCIWIIEDALSPKESGIGPKSIEVDTLVVGFFCLDYDGDDPEESNLLSKDLAYRVVDTIEKHCLVQVDGEKVFDYVKLISVEPVDFPVSSSNTVTEYGVKFEFGFRRQRIICNNRN